MNLESWFGEYAAMQVGGNTVPQYFAAAVRLALVWTILFLVKKIILVRLKKWASGTPSDFDDFVVALLGRVGWPTFAAIAVYSASRGLALPQAADRLIHDLVIVILAVRAALLLQSIIRYTVVKAYCKNRPDDPVAVRFAETLANMIRWILWAVAAIFVLDNLGVNISTLVTGLGIGGIAVAMASQAILGDLFSAVCIFIDRPFEVGDFVVIDGDKGTIEAIGLKTTKIRSLDGEQLVISNSDLTKSRIKNYKRMESRRASFEIGVTYQTPAEKLRRIPDLIRQILSKLPLTTLDRVHFSSLGSSALNFQVVYFVQSPDYKVFMDQQQEINYRLKELFDREGIEFAYPTQTVYEHRLPAMT